MNYEVVPAESFQACVKQLKKRYQSIAEDLKVAIRRQGHGVGEAGEDACGPNAAGPCGPYSVPTVTTNTGAFVPSRLLKTVAVSLAPSKARSTAPLPLPVP